eukprot:7716291-Pyramimonas_sp.AAC.1
MAWNGMTPVMVRTMSSHIDPYQEVSQHCKTSSHIKTCETHQDTSGQRLHELINHASRAAGVGGGGRGLGAPSQCSRPARCGTRG